MKKVLMIVNNLTRGGIENVCYNIVLSLKNMYQFDFLVGIPNDIHHYYEEKLQNIGCNIYKSCYITKNTKKKFLKRLQQLIRKNKYDVVHSHLNFMNSWTLRVAKLNCVKIRISHCHATYPNKDSYPLKLIVKRKIQQYLLNRYSNYRLGCSKQACIDHYGNSDAFVYFNGFDINKFLNLNCNKKNPYSVITVGRICEEKNPFFIIEIMRELVRINPKYHLFWIGDGNLKREVEQKINQFNLINNIYLVGATTEFADYIEQASAAIYPSISEGLGISVVEAQLAHCLTFASEVIPKEVDIGYVKFLSLNYSAKVWADTIDTDINKNPLNYTLNDYEKFDINNSIKLIKNIYDGS